MRYLAFLAILSYASASVLQFKPHDLQGVECPDGVSECPTGNTCCLQEPGKFGCCPLPDANCCSDRKHCCPSDAVCDIARSLCNKTDGTTLKIFRKTEATRKNYSKVVRNKKPYIFEADMKNTEVQPIISWKKVIEAQTNHFPGGVMCPDKKSECRNGETCCLTADKLKYGCCGFSDAECCKDGVHCCPSGYTCDLQHGQCVLKSSSVPLQPQLKSKLVQNVQNVPCPGGSYSCPDGHTCCKLKSGAYGCCPQPKAVCCSDGVHCCPEGYTCVVSSGQCRKGDSVVEWMVKLNAVKSSVGSTSPNSQLKSTLVRLPVQNVPCPGSGFSCRNGQTCCKLKSGAYGCCPEPKAVCCSDGVHCCPEGYTCVVSSGQCRKGDSVVEWMVKLNAVKSSVGITCPDGGQCKTGETCCKTAPDKYGCCSSPNARCCPDMKHCCPSGYTCDASGKRCTRNYGVIGWLGKVKSELSSQITCPDQSQCRAKETCCKTPSGYGCCPRENAVCCDDEKHCCPQGYQCKSGQCSRGDHVMEWLEKLESIKSDKVVCPDSKESCKTGQTCCKTATGYGCCPRPNAVCCDDEKHCCPQGYQCKSGQCSRGDHVMEWLEKLESVKSDKMVCPGGSQTCKTGQTCCKTASGYGCCPEPNAVCCKDGKHCCPQGTTCDVAKGTCTKGNHVMEWLEKLESVKSDKVVCPGGTESCETGQTCCKTASGYGCCPRPNAVCCSDMKHCCPSGYNCTGGQCKRGDITIEWLAKLESVKSPAKPESPEKITNTCCGNTTCCPYQGAHCCTNANYCCPKDYICDDVPFCCRDPDGKSKLRNPYYNMWVKQMARKLGITLKGPE